MRSLALVLALAACGGSSSPKPERAAPEPTPTAAPAHDFEAELARIEALADQACGCTTLPCIEEADRAVGAYLDVASLVDPITGVDPWPVELAGRYDAATKRVSDCYDAMDFLPPETNDRFTLRRLEIVADHACACTTDACRVELRDKLGVLDDDYLVPADASIERMLGADQKLARCLGAVLDDEVLAAMIVIHELRDQACACADRSCVVAPSRSYLEWVTSRGTIGHVLLAVPEVAAVSAELNACVRERM